MAIMTMFSWTALQQCVCLATLRIIISTRSAVDLAYKLHGSRISSKTVPILVLHGLLGSKRNWQSMSEKITKTTNRPVIAVDARNHGDSPHANGHTYLELAADVEQLMSTLSINKASVIGHSMGGRTGMVLALTEPSKVVNLIVADISPVPRADGLVFFPRLIDAMISVDFKEINDLTKAKKVAANTIMSSGLVDDMTGMDFILMNIGQLTDKSFGWKSNVQALKSNFDNIKSFPSEMTGKQYTRPTLFIGGGNSDYIPPGDITEIKKFFPLAELKYIQGVGHNVHAENPPAFFNLVQEFLKSN